jgi:adenylate kinase family enzyme
LSKFAGKKIVVVGSSGCGKSTFAHKLSKKINIQHYEIDAMFWKPDWVKTPNNEFRELMDNVTSRESWIVDGNYRVVQDLTIGRADTVIWLDYSFPRVLYRVSLRTTKRLIKGTMLWHNNRESLKLALSKDSIILYMITNYKSKRNWYVKLSSSEECKDINWIHIKNKRSEKEFWESIK